MIVTNERQQKISKAFYFPEFSISNKIQENFHIPWTRITQFGVSHIQYSPSSHFHPFSNIFKSTYTNFADWKVGI
jgi:hypothetical protein